MRFLRAAAAVGALLCGTIAASAGIEAAGIDIAETAGTPFVAAVARIFPSAGQMPGDFASMIDWGDGSTAAPGAVVPTVDGPYEVRGMHKYSAPGSFTLGIVVMINGESAIKIDVTALVGPSPDAVALCPDAGRAVEGVLFHGLIAHYCSSDLKAPSTARARWGDDGTESPLTIVGDDQGVYRLLGEHTFAREGVFAVFVTVGFADGSAATTTSYVSASEFVPRAHAQITLQTDTGEIYMRAVLEVSVVDSTDEEHELRIDWGDGQSLQEKMQNENRQVLTHAYAPRDAKRIFGRKPTSRVVVTVSDVGGTWSAPVVLPDPVDSRKSISSASARASGGPGVYVEELFLGVLGRRPTKREATALVGQVGDDAGRAAVAHALVAGDAGRRRFVVESYARFLARKPRKAELAAALALMAAGAGEDAIAAKILASPRSLASSPPLLDWIDAVCAAVLGRRADPALHQLYRDTVEGGASDDAFALAVLRSAEARRRSVHDAYRRFLHRPAGPGEVASAIAAMDAGPGEPRAVLLATVLSVIDDSDIVLSSMASRPSGNANQRFVRQLYLDLFGRAVGAAELAAWNGLLARRQLTRQQIASALLASPELLRREVGHAYRQLLGRAPTADESSDALAALGSTGTIGRLRSETVGSDEHVSVRGGGTDAGNVSAILWELAGTQHVTIGPEVHDNAGDYFGRLLAAGVSREDVAQQVLFTPESVAAEVDGAFQRFLGRAADAVGSAVLAPTIARDARDQAVASLLGGAEYFRRATGPEAGIGNRVAAQHFVEVLDGLSNTVFGIEVHADGEMLKTLAGADGRRKAVERVAGSDEARRRRVAGYYASLVDTVLTLTDPRLDPSLDKLRDGAAEEDVIAAIVGSQPYMDNPHPDLSGTSAITIATGEDFLTAVYRDLLGRDPTPSEVAFTESVFPFLVSDPMSGKTAWLREQVARSVLSTGEHRRRFVLDLAAKVDGLIGPETVGLRQLVSSPAGIADLRVELVLAAAASRAP